MPTIQQKIEIGPDRILRIELPPEVSCGMYQIVLQLEPCVSQGSIWDMPKYDLIAPWPEDFTFRREQIYEEDDRGS